ELDRRANQLANALRSMGVFPETRVGLMVDRSLAMAVGILGILKSGAAYVPLDPSYPRERLSFLMRSAGLSVLVSREGLPADLPRPDVPVAWLDTDALAAQSTEKPAFAMSPDSPAYVIYTSG